MAKLIGASDKQIDSIVKYISENEDLNVALINEDPELHSEFKRLFSTISVSQIGKNLGL